jgi:hypothetical protein
MEVVQTDVTVTGAPPPKMDAFAFIAKRQRVSIDRRRDKGGIIAPIERLLGRMTGRAKISKNGSCVKAKVPVRHETIGPRIDFEKVTVESTLIEIVRLKGDTLRFIEMYRELRQKINKTTDLELQAKSCHNKLLLS